MKYLTLALLLIAMQATKPPAERQAASSSPNAAPNVTSPARVEAAPHDNQANGTDQRTAKEDLHVQTELAWFTGALVIVSILQFGALVWQARLFFRQAGIMEQHRTSLEDLAKAAKDNAAAASLNAQAVINSQRAWVSVFASHSNGVYTFRAANMGRTPAEIISYSKSTLFAHPSTLTVTPQYGVELAPPLTFLMPGKELGDQDVELETYDTGFLMWSDPERAAKLKDRTEAIVFIFRVLYRNTLSQDPSAQTHETRICFIWTPGLHPRIGGPPEYNRHT